MKKFAPLLAAILTVVVAAPALAWHVTTEPGVAPVKVSHFDPRGDPLMRITVNNDRTAYGKVCVPDEKWAQDTTFTLLPSGKTATAGECINARAGRAFTGTWSNSKEVEKVFVKDATPTAYTNWSYKSKVTGQRVMYKYVTPRHCKTKTGWHRVEPSTLTWGSTNGVKKFGFRMAKDGFYQTPWRDYVIGTTCRTFSPA
jgi:hypothetical protein